MTRKQELIPGTELPEIESLTEAAESYRQVRTARQELNLKESEQKAHLSATIHRLIEDGEITLNEADDGEEQVIYRYQDDDGNIQDVKFARGRETVKVNKSKEAHAGEDE